MEMMDDDRLLSLCVASKYEDDHVTMWLIFIFNFMILFVFSLILIKIRVIRTTKVSYLCQEYWFRTFVIFVII